MIKFIEKHYKKAVASICSLIMLLPYFSVPVLADTTYYSYNYYGLRSDGTVTGINIDVSTIHPVVLSVNYNGNVAYYMAFCLYGGGYSSQSDAQAYANLYAKLTGVSKYSNNSSSLSWTYSTTLSGTISTGSYINSSGNTVYYYCSNILPFTSSVTLYNEPTTQLNSSLGGYGVYCYSNTDLWTYTNSSSVTNNQMLINYVKYKLSGVLDSKYTIATVPAKTWLKNSETIVPSINDSLLSGGDGTTSDSGGDAGPSATSDPENGSGSGSGSSGSSSSSVGDVSQTQSQSIAEGAIAFTVEDGAFSQTQTQTIESGAVNVTVENNNAVNQQNVQWLNSIINNNSGSEEDNPFEEAISNMSNFTSVARGFASLAGVVFGWLPWWVTALFSLLMTLLFVMVVFRLIHLFI